MWSLVALKRRILGLLGNEFWRGAHFWTASELKYLMAQVGLKPVRTRGAAFFPPMGAAARLLAPAESLFARVGTLGAALLLAEGAKPSNGANSTSSRG